jgi:hypothetical protein
VFGRRSSFPPELFELLGKAPRALNDHGDLLWKYIGAKLFRGYPEPVSGAEKRRRDRDIPVSDPDADGLLRNPRRTGKGAVTAGPLERPEEGFLGFLGVAGGAGVAGHEGLLEWG